MRQLEWLSIYGSQITDEGLKSLASLPKLKTLILSRVSVTDVGLGNLKAMGSLKTLCLDGTKITDSGLVRIATLRNLRSLRVTDTGITDAGLQHLTSLPDLRVLGVWGTKVTDGGVRTFQMALPKCRVITGREPEFNKGLPKDASAINEQPQSPAARAHLRWRLVRSVVTTLRAHKSAD